MATPETFTRNTSGLLEHAQQKAEASRQKVMDAVAHLSQERQPINFNSVARTAGVTKAYLYSRQELRQKIEMLRQQDRQTKLVLVSSGEMDRKRTDKSKDVLLSAKDARIRQLESEVKRLGAEVKKLHGQLYDRV